MQLLVKISAFNVFLLCLLGGFRIEWGKARFEWGTLAPWVLALIVFLGFEKVRNPAAFDRRLESFFDRLETSRFSPRSAIVTVACLAFIAHCCRYFAFSVNYYDMGFLHQALFHPSESGVALMANLSPKESYWVDHFAPALFVLTPLFWVFQSNVGVFAVQALLIFMPVIWMLRSLEGQAGRSAQWIWALCVLSSAALRNGAIWDFREDALGFFFLSLALIFLDRAKRRMAFVFFIGFLLSKEHLWLVALGLSLIAAFEYRAYRWACVTAAISLAWGYALFTAVIPHMQSGLDAHAVNNIVSRYGEFGSSASEIIRNLLTHPANLAKLLERALFNRESIRYLLVLLAPFALLYRKPVFALAASVGILMNLASGVPAQKSLSYHYDLGFLPFLTMGLVLVFRERSRLVFSPRLRLQGAAFLLIALLASGRWPGYAVFENLPTVADVSDYRFLRAISCEGEIAAPLGVLPYFAHCPSIRAIRMPEDCVLSEASLKKQAEQDPSRRVNRNFLSVKKFILKKEEPCSDAFSAFLLSHGFHIDGVSESSRLKLSVSDQTLLDRFDEAQEGKKP